MSPTHELQFAELAKAFLEHSRNEASLGNIEAAQRYQTLAQAAITPRTPVKDSYLFAANT